MDQLVIVAMILATLVGVSLGLLGGGGSILAVPIFTLVLGMGTREAIASSLFVIAVTSVTAVALRARAGTVQWRIGGALAATGMIGGIGGSFAGRLVPETILTVLFGVTMLVTAISMIRSRREPNLQRSRGIARVVRVVIVGLAVGFLTGFLGAGGGFLIVPALTLLGLPITAAIGTSLLVIAGNSSAGLATQILAIEIQWPVILTFTAFAIAGSFIGILLARKLPAAALRKAFGWFVLAVGLTMLTTAFTQLLPTP